MALAPSVRSRPLAQALGLAAESKRTAVDPHVLDDRYTRAAWLQPNELHQSRWTQATRDAYLANAKRATLPAGTDCASGVAACLTQDSDLPLVRLENEQELVRGRGGIPGLRQTVRPTLRERPPSARGAAEHCRPQLCQVRPGTVGGAGNDVRDRTLWQMAGLSARDPAPAGGVRRQGGVLRFDCAFDYQPLDARYAIRAPATLLFYLEDDSLQINLPKDPDFAPPQSLTFIYQVAFGKQDAPKSLPNEYGDRRGRVWLKRARILESDGSLVVRADRDLNIGRTVQIHARTYEILGCDAYTRGLLERLHGHVPADLPAPHSETRDGGARTGVEARRGVGLALPAADARVSSSDARYGLQASRHLYTG
ncbi:hypothetical protein T492DRAFT_935659 [Pavlovales sp. CCMP2436]|nr:hypothetical protein T492DRAFT_935659 [Pavlovales sp. CCMP2436]